MFPNIDVDILSSIRRRLEISITPEDLFAYVAGVVAHSSYTERFQKELAASGVRVPITADPNLWSSAVEVGREVIWLHTYGERCVDPRAGRPHGPPKLTKNKPQAQIPIPDDREHMPRRPSYDLDKRTLYVGDGQISPVSPAVAAYEVSGMRVVKHWFDYRKKNPSGRRSSPLDRDITAESWTPQMTTELLELLVVLERLTRLEPHQADVLDRICDGPLITVADLEEAGALPVPQALRRAARPEATDVSSLF